MAKKESNYKIIEKINVINEPTTVYQLKTDLVEQLDPVLIKLLEKGIQDCNAEKFFTNEEVKIKVREKYPFVK